MANDLSFIPDPEADGPIIDQKTGGEDPSIDLVEELLSRLETPDIGEPPQVGPLRGTIGAGGDALLAFANILGGGRTSGSGPFGRSLELQRREFERQKFATETESRRLRNRIRIGQAFGKQKDDSTIEETRSSLIAEVKKRGFTLTPDEEKVFLLTGKLPTADDDELDDMLTMAHIGEKGVTLPEDVDPLRISAAAAKAEASKEDPDFAGFKTATALENAVRQIAKEIVSNSREPREVSVSEIDPITQLEGIKKRLMMMPTITMQEAMREAMTYFPGSEQFFNLPSLETDTQPSLTIDEVRDELRSRGAPGQ